MSFMLLGILNSQVDAGGGGAYELISSQILTSSASSVTFSSIPQDYKHLQIRYVAQSTRTQTDNMRIRLNGDTGNNYAYHELYGNSGSVTSSASTSASAVYPLVNSNFHNAWTSGVIDLLDYSNTSKNTTLRMLSGMPSSDLWRVSLLSGLWANTAAVNSVGFSLLTGPNYYTGSRFSLYGIRG